MGIFEFELKDGVTIALFFHDVEECLPVFSVLFTFGRNFPWFLGFFGEKYGRIISFFASLVKNTGKSFDF